MKLSGICCFRIITKTIHVMIFLKTILINHQFQTLHECDWFTCKMLMPTSFSCECSFTLLECLDLMMWTGMYSLIMILLCGVKVHLPYMDTGILLQIKKQLHWGKQSTGPKLEASLNHVDIESHLTNPLPSSIQETIKSIIQLIWWFSWLLLMEFFSTTVLKIMLADVNSFSDMEKIQI